MLSRPRFEVVEWWDDSGDVEVIFRDEITPKLRRKLHIELEDAVAQLEDYQNTIYHVEGVMEFIFHKMNREGRMQAYNVNGRIIWS